MRLFTILGYTQGVYYVATGIWPLLHMESFIWITSPKTDLWLVKMVGLLTVAIALTLLSNVMKREPSNNILLATTSALAYFSIDVYYALNGTISTIYLADALAEAILILGWIAGSVLHNAKG